MLTFGATNDVIFADLPGSLTHLKIPMNELSADSPWLVHVSLSVSEKGTHRNWTQRWTSPHEVCFNLDTHIVRVPD